MDNGSGRKKYIKEFKEEAVLSNGRNGAEGGI